MPKLFQRWHLHDYGTLQFLWDSCTGESIEVYGPNQVRDGGPWCFESEEDSLLVSVEADLDELQLDPDEVSRYQIRSDENHILEIVEKDDPLRSFTSLSEWKALGRRTFEHKALRLHVAGHEPFNAAFTWQRAPTYCGDKPVKLWMHFGWLIDYVFGKTGADVIYVYAKNHKRYLEKMKLDPSHVQHSARSQENKRRKTETGALATEPIEDDAPVWQVSMFGAILFLEFVSLTKEFIRQKVVVDADITRAKAKALLGAMLSWPHRGLDEIAFSFPVGVDIFLQKGKVDKDV